MKQYFAYIRVSTTRQGEEGVSLQEQRAAILEYATKRGITIREWFEEQVSAAKRGRPVFTKVVGLLKSKKAAGIVIHKIDRGARNLRDWADMAELMDRGIEVHFAHESIDLHTRSGRLSADILAVVAADYVRNLREETVKGISGRLRQGLFPFAAPVGYVNNGGGRVKTVDPVLGPLVREAFELYATRKYSLQALQGEMAVKGLRTKTGRMIAVGHLSAILRNPFYMGLIRCRNRPEMYPGIHAPLVSSSLFNEVQLLIGGKRTKFKHCNRLLFRLFIRCENCRLFYVGERQKGHIYYRCHRRLCPRECIKEERLQEAVTAAVKRLNIQPEEESAVTDALEDLKKREIVAKGQRRFEGFDKAILSLHARGLTTREIEGYLLGIYGVEVSPGLVSQVTEAVCADVKVWQQRPLDEVYPIVYFDALWGKVRTNGQVAKVAVYLALGIKLDGNKEVLGMWAANSEGAKF